MLSLASLLSINIISWLLVASY
uniref:Uncharacterized protein n=1 Tax=Anguilla anguilla TaxID=7936 RepID=A0A0E9TIG2_ANGAN